jgi:hypothetical protein
MTANKVPILLTSSVIAHDTGVALKDTEARIHLALESVSHWLKIDPKLEIVLCDGSNHDFSSIVTEKFPSSQIECLSFENDQELVKKFGRGYGEGEIVRYALKHSKFINRAGCFAKCTSKLWVDNYAQCLKSWNGKLLYKGVFLNVFSLFKKTVFSYIDTRFYIISCSVYTKYFENAHLQIRADQGKSLEECFHEVFIQNNIYHSLFNVAPVINGVGGGTGKYYKNSNLRKIKEVLRINLVKQNSSFKHLFVES